MDPSRKFAEHSRGRWLDAATVVLMERWQQLGYESYGAWRRATEKARQQTRRAVQKASQLHSSWNFSPLPAPPQPRAAPMMEPQTAAAQPPSIRGSVVQHATVHSAAQSAAVQSAAVQSGAEQSACLPGRLAEQALVTPNGRRRHKFEHTSPGGTSRVDEYVSPADGQHQQRAHGRRLECLHRLAAARRIETRVRVFGCGTCEACKEYAQSREGCSVLWNSKPYLPWNGKRKPLDAMGPHELKRSRSKYQDCVS